VTTARRKDQIAIQLARGSEALESAEILLAAAKHADAVSRAYYAAFHHASALLVMGGEQARRHGGVERLLQRDLVRTGKLDAAVARSYAHLLKDRQDADYGAETVFTAELAAERIAAARTFCAAARAILLAEGWLA
jgi:hypothetical protein